MIKELFPNANIVADRFHIVTQAYHELNKVRISVMKQFGSDSKEYLQLKRFWKLLMKHGTALDYTTRKSRVNFNHAYLTDKEVIDRLLALSDELRDAYAFYQGILYAIETRDEAELKSVLYPTKNDAQYRSLPKAMKKARRTIRKHFDEIINSLSTHSQIDRSKVQTIKSKPLSARHTGPIVSKTVVYVFLSHSRIVSTQWTISKRQLISTM